MNCKTFTQKLNIIKEKNSHFESLVAEEKMDQAFTLSDEIYKLILELDCHFNLWAKYKETQKHNLQDKPIKFSSQSESGNTYIITQNKDNEEETDLYRINSGQKDITLIKDHTGAQQIHEWENKLYTYNGTTIAKSSIDGKYEHNVVSTVTSKNVIFDNKSGRFTIISSNQIDSLSPFTTISKPLTGTFHRDWPKAVSPTGEILICTAGDGAEDYLNIFKMTKDGLLEDPEVIEISHSNTTRPQHMVAGENGEFYIANNDSTIDKRNLANPNEFECIYGDDEGIIRQLIALPGGHLALISETRVSDSEGNNADINSKKINPGKTLRFSELVIWDPKAGKSKKVIPLGFNNNFTTLSLTSDLKIIVGDDKGNLRIFGPSANS